VAIDPHIQEVSKVITDLGIKGVDQIERIEVFAITGEHTEKEIETICKELLVDQLIQNYCYTSPKGTLLDLVSDKQEKEKWLAFIQYRPGVTDPSEERIRDGIRVLGIETVHSVKTASLYLFQGRLTAQTLEMICEKVLANDVIQTHSTCELDHCTEEEIRILRAPVSDTLEKSEDSTRPLFEEIQLRDAEDVDLMKISKGWRLSLNLTEMKQIQTHYVSEGREPTDIELNTIAQTWSEHCYHKTFKLLIETDDEKINGLLKTYIMRATKELNKPWCISTFVDNAGIVEFDEEYGIAVKVETHNHPTALDPFGGAGTGTGGVLRDIMGVGAKPILSTDILFFGLLDTPHEKLPRGLLHPIRMMKGAVAGIADYGNKMGIPTANGAIFFDEGYLYNPLVFAGSVGIMPRTKYVRNQKSGDIILVVGGKTGMDGIHGVTFASAELSEETQSLGSAVQIGNPVEEKKVLEGLLRARDRYEKPLYSAVTDCGGGGLSSAIGETARDLGAIVDLEKIPLKHRGMKPWQI
jgi:phosphoribosylformylglycinamidine synthase